MNKFIQDVYDFHKKYGFTVPSKPTALAPELFDLKAGHILEEANEYKNAPDAAHRLDAIIDTIYVSIGAGILEFPPQLIEQAWDSVHAANMTKLRAEKPSDSTRGSSFDVIKPKDFQPPNIEKIVQDALNLEEHNS